MAPTVHKVLMLGYQIIKTSIVPVGCLSEHASESRNKVYKSDRSSHARKCSRLDNITDVLNTAMDSSDPLLATFCLKERQRKSKIKKLPTEVLELLQSPQIHTAAEINNDVEDSGQDSSDEETDEPDGLGLNENVLEKKKTTI